MPPPLPGWPSARAIQEQRLPWGEGAAYRCHSDSICGIGFPLRLAAPLATIAAPMRTLIEGVESWHWRHSQCHE